MSRSCLRRFRLGKLSPVATLPPLAPRRNLHASAHHHDAALDLPTAGLPSTSTTILRARNLADVVTEQKVKVLEAAVKGERGDYNRAWGCYVDLLNFVAPNEIPLELHQRVLRRCSLAPAESRQWLARRLAIGRRPALPHVHEVRYRAIIHNMRVAGYTPSIDDYHYILRQFAAVGHHIGAVHVLNEIRHMGLPTTPKTYGLCLMAMCHHLSLPCWHLDRPALVAEVTKLSSKLLKDMWEDGVPVTAITVDLTMRVFKETLDLEGFERLMKVAYGVDFAYPDRPPLEFWGEGRTTVTDLSIRGPHLRPLQLSTATLNTTIDVLGRLGQVSRLVQAFEVLTTPLKSAAAPSSTYYDDEDDDFGDANPAVAPFPPPHTTPNTTTYFLLLKWLSKAGHAVLLRHYLLQAIHLDRATEIALRHDCWHTPRGEILAPHFAVNRRLVLPVFAEANGDKNMELLRWLLVKMQIVLRRKRKAIAYYTETEQRWQKEDAENRASPAPGPSPKPIPLSTIDPLEAPSNESPSSPPTSSSIAATSPESISPDLNIDLEAASPPPPPPKVFDISNHVRILRRDTEELEALERRMLDVLGRNSQRVKERLGRRVWGDQNIYLRTAGHRIVVPREMWRRIVNFRPAHPRRQQSPRQNTKSGASGRMMASHGFFTSKKYRGFSPHIPSRMVHTKPS